MKALVSRNKEKRFGDENIFCEGCSNDLFLLEEVRVERRKLSPSFDLLFLLRFSFNDECTTIGTTFHLIVVGSMDTDVGRIGDIVILIGSDKLTMHCLTDSALRAGRVR